MNIKKICLKISCIIIIVVIILSSYILYLPCGNISTQEKQDQAQPQNIQIEEPIAKKEDIIVASTEEKCKKTNLEMLAKYKINI